MRGSFGVRASGRPRTAVARGNSRWPRTGWTPRSLPRSWLSTLARSGGSAAVSGGTPHPAGSTVWARVFLGSPSVRGRGCAWGQPLVKARRGDLLCLKAGSSEILPACANSLALWWRLPTGAEALEARWSPGPGGPGMAGGLVEALAQHEGPGGNPRYVPRHVQRGHRQHGGAYADGGPAGEAVVVRRRLQRLAAARCPNPIACSHTPLHRSHTV